MPAPGRSKNFVVQRRTFVLLCLAFMAFTFSTASIASLTNVTATQDATDTTSPYAFTVSYTIATSGNGRAQGATLEYDDGSGYTVLVACDTSSLPNGNINGNTSPSSLVTTGQW